MFPQMWPWPNSNRQARQQLGFVSEVVGDQASQPYNQSSSHHPPPDPYPVPQQKPLVIPALFIWAQDVRYGAISYYLISTGTKITLLFPDVN